MSLPKQVLPIFSLIIPSTKQKINFRPFTVREEKVLAQAQLSEDINVISNSIKEIIKNCCEGIKNVDELALFDIEYIITRIRAKSSGEYIDLKMPCDIDPNHEKAFIRLNLETLEVHFPEGHETKIHLFDDVGVQMRYPTLGDLEKFEEASGLDAIILCTESIFTSDEIFYAKEQTKEELEDFYNSLTKQQIEKIEDKFFKRMPRFEYNLEYECPTCGHKHKKLLKGLSNFFD